MVFKNPPRMWLFPWKIIITNARLVTWYSLKKMENILCLMVCGFFRKIVKKINIWWSVGHFRKNFEKNPNWKFIVCRSFRRTVKKSICGSWKKLSKYPNVMGNRKKNWISQKLTFGHKNGRWFLRKISLGIWYFLKKMAKILRLKCLNFCLWILEENCFKKFKFGGIWGSFRKMLQKIHVWCSENFFSENSKFVYYDHWILQKNGAKNPNLIVCGSHQKNFRKNLNLKFMACMSFRRIVKNPDLVVCDSWEKLSKKSQFNGWKKN